MLLDYSSLIVRSRTFLRSENSSLALGRWPLAVGLWQKTKDERRNLGGTSMAVQTSALNIGTSSVVTSTWRSRTLAILLMVGDCQLLFWVDSRYPALMKRYNAGTQVKAVGALTFGAVYPVDRSMPYLTRVWRTTVNWLDANRVGMTFSFLFGPAALAFLSTLRRRRTTSRYLNTLIGAAVGCASGSVQQLHCAHRAGTLQIRHGHGIRAGRHVRLARSQPGCAGHDFCIVPVTQLLSSNSRTVLFLILVFVPFISARQADSELPFNFAVEIPSNETWGQAMTNTARSYARSFWTVFRVAFPLMILAAVLGAFAVELLPQQALSGSVTAIGIIAVALISAFLPVPMAFDVASRLHPHGEGRAASIRRRDPVHTRDHQCLTHWPWWEKQSPGRLPAPPTASS